MSKQEAFKGVSVGNVLAGKYRVEKILGMGGMGIVVAATHLDLRELRAIKLIRPDADNDQSVERFLREARAVVRLQSEHVPEVYDLGRLESGAPYIVMELLQGQDLSAILKAHGPLPIADAVRYVVQACHALAEAHAVGIVHRDLKPGNLFVTRRRDDSECIKVLDFGVSKDTKPGKHDPEMTGAKDLIGSPLYMSPEQMRSARKVDARSDVWALGAILYKLLTGRAPFHAPTMPEIFALTLGKQVRPPSSLRPEIPRELEAIILCCLDKQPRNRYPTAAELGAALLALGIRENPITEPPIAPNYPTRRTTIPPPSPISIEIELSESEARTSVVNPLLLPATSTAEVSEPMMGLARSNRIIRSGTPSKWNGVRSLLRPALVVFMVAMSIFSAFVGAIVVSVVPLPDASFGLRPRDASSIHERSPEPVVVTPSPPFVPAPSVAHVDASAPVVIHAPSALSPVSSVPPLPKTIRRPPFALPPRPPTPSASASSTPFSPAKPKPLPVAEDLSPDRD
ncbi:MAG TPA: protein kinase [Polyangium sp.]|nr:protein kinase [Polyangium sp.]